MSDKDMLEGARKRFGSKPSREAFSAMRASMQASLDETARVCATDDVSVDGKDLHSEFRGMAVKLKDSRGTLLNKARRYFEKGDSAFSAYNNALKTMMQGFLLCEEWVGKGFFDGVDAQNARVEPEEGLFDGESVTNDESNEEEHASTVKEGTTYDDKGVPPATIDDPRHVKCIVDACEREFKSKFLMLLHLESHKEALPWLRKYERKKKGGLNEQVQGTRSGNKTSVLGKKGNRRRHR